VLAISFVKTPDKPYDWHITKKIYTVARDSITIISQMFKIDTDIDTAEANIGFSEDGSLRAGLKERTDIVLSFRSDYQLEKSVYLAGKFFDSFDGKEWHSTTAGYREGYDEKTLDTLITMSQVKQTANHHMEDYVLPVKIDVKYAGARTRYAFAPSKMTMQNSDFGRKKITPAGDGLVFDRTSGMFTEYMISYHRLNRDNSVFRELCEGAQVISEENWNSYAKNALGTAGAVYTYEDYLKYQDYVYDTYLGDAAKENADAAEVNADTSLEGGDAAAQYLSDAMAEELNSFIDPSDDTMTKLAKITDYLAQMSYTRNPGPIPESVDEAADFLDYFCLENRKGFCCHFATAFVLLARSQGIPARYVQGYLVRPKGEKKVRVLSNMAHAWPEVFIDNVGWVTCEATTGYKADNSWLTFSEKQAISEENARKAQGIADAERARLYSEDGMPTGAPGDVAGEENADGEEEKSAYRAVLQTGLLILLLIAAFVTIFFAIERHLRRGRYEKLSDTDKALFLCRRNMKILRMLGQGIDEAGSETLEEYRARVGGLYELGFIDVFELMLYAKREPDSTEIEKIDSAGRALMDRLKAERRFMYILYVFSGG